MNKILNLFKNLKIKTKLYIVLTIIIFNFIILYLFSTFFNNTNRSFIALIYGEQSHTQYFEMGLSSFFMFVHDKDTAQFNKAIQYISEANKLAETMIDIDSIVENTTKQEFRDFCWDVYAESFHNDINTVNIFADRTHLFVSLEVGLLNDIYVIAANGAHTGNKIINLMNKYKTTNDPTLIAQITEQSEIIHNFYALFSKAISNAINYGTKILQIVRFSILILVLIISFISINIMSRYLHKSFALLINKSQKIAVGNINIKKLPPSNDEIGWLHSAFNSIIESTQKMVNYSNSIAHGDYDSRITPRSKNDTLSIALNAMAENLHNNKVKNNIENWQTEGVNRLNKQISGDLNIGSYAQNTLNFLISYFEALNGCFYLAKDGFLNLLYQSGLKDEKIHQSIPLNSGIYQQAIKATKCTHISNLQDIKFNSFTGTGEITPRDLIIIPLVANKKNLGIIEITSSKSFSNEALDLFEILREIISITLHVNLSHFQVIELLGKTQQQAEELEVQQEELRTSNAELEEQTQLLRDNESELQAQQEELRVTNEELEERTHDLEFERNQVVKNSTELEKAKEIVEQKAREVEIASKYKSEFLANMSHELRTPLNSLLLLSKDLAKNKSNTLDESQIESANIIYNSGNDLLSLINDILDLSKIESGKMIVNPEFITLSEIDDDLKSVFSHLAKDKKLYFKTTIIGGNDTPIYNDRQKINQILKNLISNAIKFTQIGGITVTYILKSNNIIINVADTGIGIPKSKQMEIFEAFQQVDGSISRNYGGTGLGLSISRELAKLLSGSISLDSTEGKGSEFTLVIPATYNEDAPDNALPLISKPSIPPINNKTEPSAKEIKTDNHSNGKEKVEELIFIEDDRNNIDNNDKTILIIEDDLILAKNLKMQCYDVGFKCIVSGTGENGLVLAEKYKPHAIILDIKLPGIDGYKVLEILKENHETRHIPVQLMSSNDPELNEINNLSIGFLQKPIIPENLAIAFSKISAHIDKNIKDLLIIEDDEANRIMVSKLLGGKDVNITTTDSGLEALQFMKKNLYDCVVLDLGIKDISGLELIREISTNCKKELPPIIVYTARDLTIEETRELQRHTKSIIIKGTMSDGRLLDETALFLHRVVDDMSETKKDIIRKLHNKEAVFENKTVLLVDDDMRNVFALTKIFKDHNLNVIEAENGQVAIDKLNTEEHIDIVLMDVMMPVMDGLTAIKKIRSSNKHNNLPIIVLTAKAMKEDRINAIKSGANDYLSKPVDAEKLLSLMRVWLYNK